jgi:hypothetical protein
MALKGAPLAIEMALKAAPLAIEIATCSDAMRRFAWRITVRGADTGSECGGGEKKTTFECQNTGC